MNRSLKYHLRWWPAIGAICIGVTAPSLNPYLLHVVFMVLIYAYLGLAWNIVSGMGGQLSLGHALYLGTGAYTSMLLFLHFGISPWIGMWIGGILAAGLAALIGAITFRSGLAHDYYVLSTIAVAQAAMIAVANTHFLGGASGLSLPYVADSWWNMQMNSKLGYVYIALAFLAGGMLIARRLDQGATGLKLRALRENESMAESAGVNVYREKVLASTYSAFLTALGGAILAFYVKFIDPHMVLSLDMSLRIVFLSMVGGIGTAFGPLWGAMFLVPMDELTRVLGGSKLAGLGPLIYGAILTLVILYAPKGIGDLPRLIGRIRRPAGNSTDVPRRTRRLFTWR